jgi:Flp pilus assembly protein TadB
MVVGAIVAAALLCWIEPDYIDAFLGNPKGPWLLATAAILQVIGGIWVWRILKS